jgi:drug/metabolite transporter (DMT)-like permease
VSSWLFPVAVLVAGFTMYGWTWLACGVVILGVMFMVDRSLGSIEAGMAAGLAAAVVLAWAFA